MCIVWSINNTLYLCNTDLCSNAQIVVYKAPPPPREHHCGIFWLCHFKSGIVPQKGNFEHKYLAIVQCTSNILPDSSFRAIFGPLEVYWTATLWCLTIGSTGGSEMQPIQCTQWLVLLRITINRKYIFNRPFSIRVTCLDWTPRIPPANMATG